jgi:predicted NBD/HSP70 family sugar kinase
MPGMKIVVPHTLTTEEAMGRIQNLLTEIKRDYGDRVSDLKEQWTGDRGEFSFRAMGFAVSGTLQARPGEVVLEGTYPWAAAPFKGKIESMIRDRATQLLAS